MNPIKLARLRRRITEIEDEIEGLEGKQARLQAELVGVGGNRDARVRITKDLEASLHQIQLREDEWAELSELVAAEA